MVEKRVGLKETDGIWYQMVNGRKVENSPWSGSLVAPFYDNIIKGNVFPKKFGSSYEKHAAILREELSGLHGMKVLCV